MVGYYHDNRHKEPILVTLSKQLRTESDIPPKFESCVRDVFKVKNWNFTRFLDQVKKQQKFDDALQACLCLCLPVQPAALAEKILQPFFQVMSTNAISLCSLFLPLTFDSVLELFQATLLTVSMTLYYVKDRNNTWGKVEASANCHWGLKKCMLSLKGTEENNVLGI